jgi:pimeloyl-ACP methyl ester carboxylesterase
MIKKILLTSIPTILLLAVLGFIIWGSTPLQPTSEAISSLQSTPTVKVEIVQGWTIFRPSNNPSRTGFIFYPGGRVDYRAYAPLLHAIAEQGYLVVLTPMTLNLAVFGIETAGTVLGAFPEIQHWALGGHSLGGSMAAQYVINHPGQLAGLVFWASYPAASLLDNPVQVLSISAGNDGLATPAKIDDSRKLLTPASRFVVIVGGCHAQFGSYGPQPGDGTPTIAPAAQWQQTVAATVDFLQQIGK